MQQRTVRIVGGGVSGLTAAITLARQGVGVEVFEKRLDSGTRHPHRCDAVENWTTQDDFRDLLTRWSIDASPFHAPASVEVRAFDGECHALIHRRPLFYLVQRGAGPGCLEHALKEQALQLGARLRYGQTLARERADIWAAGLPRRGFFLDVGITFRTAQPDRAVVLVDRRLAPRACAYLIVVGGLGTLAVLLTEQFRRARALLHDTIEVFQRMHPFDMRDVHVRGGFGGALNALGDRQSSALVVGEAAGLMDYLWGFGIRHAILSGVLAARALLGDGEYETLVAQEIRPLVQSSLINRKFYDRANNHLYRALVRHFCSRPDPHGLLRRFYRSRRLRAVLWPWVAGTLAGEGR